ncbi:MAG TPA: hypothetical protein VH415_01305 [Nitrososphaeraceae archaeon]|jgi:hypothetical protein
MTNLDSHSPEHEDELDIMKLMNLNEAFAIDMQNSGISAEAVELGTLDLEREEYYNNDFGSTPRIVTNKGCIKLNGSIVDLVQIIQRN